jgi:squalene synthase HpnC
MGVMLETEDSDRVNVLIDIDSRATEQSSAENFPVALRILPAGPRDQLMRLYRFARFVDDVGDEAAGDRLRLLDLVAADVRALEPSAARSPALPPVAAMAPVLSEHGAPVQPLLDLVEANRMDQTTTRYPGFEDLLDYCRLSAAPIGQMVLYIADAATQDNIAASDAVCAGLQVLEHCQDVGEDARAGRVYLPDGDLRTLGVPHDALLAATTSVQLRRVVEIQVRRARQLLDQGRPLVRRLSGWAKLAVSGYVAGGLATATALKRHDYDVLGRQIRPSRTETAVRALGVAARRDPR